MITIEQHYLSSDEVSVTGSSDTIDYQLTFINEGDSVYVTVVCRGKDAFRKLLDTIVEMGEGLLEDIT